MTAAPPPLAAGCGSAAAATSTRSASASIHLDACEIDVVEQVHKSALGPLKDDEDRTAQIQDALLPILEAWKLKTGGEGLLFKPEQPGRRAGRGTGAPATFVRPHTLHWHLCEALEACEIPPIRGPASR